ncbi:hypothetical protein ACIHCQ_41695 [Streptomyces sp. NPDC052236]|uniref:hypothetical protein n=1 Tax=Streptomyces sp. NPDC052236 TaxID=3365686 RepID=UPI0037D57648
MAGVRLDFSGWSRSAIYTTVTDPALTASGRLTGHVDVTLRNTEPPRESIGETLAFDLLGPGDVAELKPGGVLHMMPPPGTADFEETKCVYTELSAADLPWRYTPELAAGRTLRPWIVLVVGTPAEAALQPGGTITLTDGVLAAHDLRHSARWAHLQDDADHPGLHRVVRLLSPRDLAANTDYIAAVVPAFAADGRPSWDAGTAQVTLPVHHWWSFSTGQEGDFPTLAARLKTGGAADLGRAPMRYTPLDGGEPLLVRGALAPVGSVDDAVPPSVAADLALRTGALIDPRRPVISLPQYGDAWVADPSATVWGGVFRTDPRHRAVAGLGLKAGIDAQDLLADAASAQAGALDEAAARIRHLTAGIAAARSLWTRRLPADPIRRLVLLGPALRRVLTPSGTVLARATGTGRPLPSAIFSAAARRVLRTGPARTALAADRATDPRAVLVAANTCPPLPPRAPKGLPHGDSLSEHTGTVNLDKAIAAGVASEKVPLRRFSRLVESFDRSPYSPSTVRTFDQVMRFWLDRGAEGQPIPLLAMLTILDPPDGEQPPEDELLTLLRGLGHGDAEPDTDSLLELATGLVTRPPERPCTPVALDALATAVGSAFNPTVARPFVADRVLETITGLDDQALTPPELCPDLDVPAWQLLRDRHPDWLLPGAGTMESDRVIAMTTNPAFVDAFLLGLNTQTIGELRFRNIPIRTGCTPLRQFWAHTHPTGESYDDDIVGVHRWPDASPLGSPGHRPPAATSDLVVVFRTPLFRRYPQTVVYLAPTPLNGTDPDWQAEPDLANRILPSFQGVVTPEIVFFGFDLDPGQASRYWVVLEEPPHGVQFFSGPTPGMTPQQVAVFTDPAAHPDGGSFADAAFADPYRVMIRGASLIPVTT